MKSSVYPAVIIGLLGCVGLILLWLNLNISISTETESPPTQSSPRNLSSPPSAVTSTASNSVKKDTKTISSAPTGSQGGLRMSNQTDQPVRVALLPKQSTATKTTYGKPAHWDFAPQEGSTKGLILSLPKGNFKLKQGDILVAFAQDGSGRYWGPYVVGTTSAPVWDQKTAQWQLTLQQ